MNQSEELLNRIKVLEHENSVLQQTINELQEHQQYYQPSNGIFSFQSSPMDYIVGDFWLQPANNYWNLTKHRARRRNTLFSDFRQDFPWMVSDDGDNFGYGCMVAEDSPEVEENEELKQKVCELKKKIEKLEQKMEEQNSPLVFVVEAIKEKARFDSPSEAFKLFQKLDYIFRNCDQWKENVKELKDFLLREKNRAMLPPPPCANYPTDQQLADAIGSICGEGKELNDYQSWLGVCCYASARCGYPLDLKICCEKLKQLPYRDTLYREVKFDNIRMFSNWNFVKAGYEQWPNMKINDQERTLFVKCRDTAMALEIALNKAQE